MVVLVIRLGQSQEGFRIDPILDVWSIDADQNDLPAALDGHLGGWTERDVGHFHLIGWSFDHDVAALPVSLGNRASSGQRRETA